MPDHCGALKQIHDARQTRGDEDGCWNDGKQDAFKFHGEITVATIPLNGRPKGLVMSRRDQLLGMAKQTLATTIVDS